LIMIWLQFLVCTAAIVFAGAKLSEYGDVIAEKTGLGRTWIGVVLMASVTSLPELMTGVSSVAIFDLPNIAAGDALGSCMFNLLIIALLDVVVLQGAAAHTHQREPSCLDLRGDGDDGCRDHRPNLPRQQKETALGLGFRRDYFDIRACD